MKYGGCDVRSLAINQSASRRAASTRRQMLMARPCTSCGNKRDTTMPLCKSCRSEDNKNKKTAQIRREVEVLVFKAGITFDYFERAETEYRQQMLADAGAGGVPPDRGSPTVST